jgi:hypothetical protein
MVWVTKNDREGFQSEDGKGKDSCYRPTADNPFMNNLLTDDPDRPEACRLATDEADAKWRQGLYQDFDKIYSNHSSERQFYTTPNTTNPNKQKEFAQWLYGNPNQTCKEEGLRCTGKNV